MVILSEITNGYGDAILPQYLTGEQSIEPINDYQFPQQPSPLESEWEIWRAIVHQLFISGATTLRLMYPLIGWDEH